MCALDLAALERKAGHAAVTVGTMIRATRRERLVIETKGHATDLVTQADVEAELTLTSLLLRALPEVTVVGEERGGEIPDNGLCWVVDPLDGTANFVAGLPFYCTSIALLQDGIPVVAAVYAPEQHELFTARLGGGTFLNSRPASVTQGGELERMVIAVRPSLNRRAGQVDTLNEAAGLARVSLGVRSLGSSALELAWVACGRFGAMFHPRLHPWDVAAGALLISEAGGRLDRAGVRRFIEPGGQPVLASNGAVHASVSAIVGHHHTTRHVTSTTAEMPTLQAER